MMDERDLSNFESVHVLEGRGSWYLERILPEHELKGCIDAKKEALTKNIWK